MRCLSSLQHHERADAGAAHRRRDGLVVNRLTVPALHDTEGNLVTAEQEISRYLDAQIFTHADDKLSVVFADTNQQEVGATGPIMDSQ